MIAGHEWIATAMPHSECRIDTSIATLYVGGLWF
jgi:hypothetical protein